MEGDRRFWISVQTENNPVWDPPKFHRWILFTYLMRLAKKEQRPENQLRRIIWQGKERKLEPGSITINYREIARELKWSLGMTSKYLGSLHQLGIITIFKAKGSTPYSILTLCKWKEYQPEWVGNRTPRERHVNASRTPREHPKSLRRDGEKDTKSIDGFDEFWERLPKKVGRQEALDEWRKLRPDPETVEAIHKALDWQIPIWKASIEDHQGEPNPSHYVLHPARWLKRRKWEDEHEEETPKRRITYHQAPAQFMENYGKKTKSASTAEGGKELTTGKEMT